MSAQEHKDKSLTAEEIEERCEECKRRKAKTTYSNMKVCEYCSNKLNDYFDEEYR